MINIVRKKATETVEKATNNSSSILNELKVYSAALLDKSVHM